ncbi:MAG: hypothetical protein R3F49_16520 [Planctomycetota bacterium]
MRPHARPALRAALRAGVLAAAQPLVGVLGLAACAAQRPPLVGHDTCGRCGLESVSVRALGME